MRDQSAGGADIGQPGAGGASGGVSSAQAFLPSTTVNTSKSAVGGVVQQQAAPQ